MGSVNVAIIGVGNCASSLVQGVHYYREAREDDFVPGLMHVNLGGYHISDINFVAAFDIDKLVVRYGDQIAFERGCAGSATRADLVKAGRQPRWTLHVDLGVGDAEGYIYGCDLSKEYVQINIGES